MFRSRTEGKILKNIPGFLGDNGEVYEQYVFIELLDGTVIALFDPDGHSKNEMVGTIKTIGILAFIAQVEKIPSPKKGVDSMYRSGDEVICAEKEPIVFFGEVVGTDEKWDNIYVDFGVGILQVDFCWDGKDAMKIAMKNYKIGDYVRVEGGRNDLTGVWDFHDTGGSGWVHIVHNHVNSPSGNQFLTFSYDYYDTEEIKNLIMKAAQGGLPVTENVYHYVEESSGKTLRLIIADNGYIVTAHPYTGFAVNDAVKEKTEVPVRILDVRPDAEYLKKTYTQLVRVEFANGLQTLVFDDDLLCKAEMVGKTKEITLAMLVNSLEKIEYVDKCADPDITGPSLGIRGLIEEIIIPDDPKDAERWHHALIDFGVGKVLIEIDKTDFRHQLQEGDYVHVDGRVDVYDIE